MADEPQIVELTAEEAAAQDKLESEIITDVAQRVHTILCNYSLVRARGRREQALNAVESRAILNGAVSGIAVLVARMAISRSADADPADQRTPEEFYAEILSKQFIHTYREVQQQDAAVDISKGAPVN